MADTKITALAAITTVDPANDVLPIVDVSDTSMAASGTTKKITTNQILGSSGTATLASATITGDLTVRTNKLAVTSTGVGIGTATPGTACDVASGTVRVKNAAGDLSGLLIYQDTGDASKIFNYYNGSIQFGINNTTAMTLNSTGLGVGVAPSAARFEVGGQDGTQFYIRSTGTASARIRGFTNSVEAGLIGFLNGGGIYFDVNGERMRIDTSGNVGIGVTPSAWASNRKALQVGGLAAASLALNGTSNVSEMFFNSFINTSASNVYAVNGRAGLIDFGSGGFGFSIDSGTQTAGAACNFTRAMTLDASGNLLVGTTSSNGSISNASYVIGGIFSTLNGILSSVATATPTTLFAAPSESTLMVTASVNGASPSDYKVVAVVKRGGAAVAITTISSATNITITSSGTNIQVTQTSGGTQNIYFNVIRLA